MLRLKCLKENTKQPKAFIITALVTGCRRGEIAALTWNVIDMDEHEINVTKAASYLSGKGFFVKEPKTNASVRKIAVPETLIRILREYRTWQLEERIKVGDQWEQSEEPWLFTTWDGHITHPDTFTSIFKKFIQRHKLPDIRLHDLRHTNSPYWAIHLGQVVSLTSSFFISNVTD